MRIHLISMRTQEYDEKERKCKWMEVDALLSLEVCSRIASY